MLYRNWRYEQELDSLLWKVNYKDIEIKEAKDETAVSPSDQLFKNNNSKVFKLTKKKHIHFKN